MEPYHSNVNRVNPYCGGSDPKRNLTYAIPCKRSLSLLLRLHQDFKDLQEAIIRFLTVRPTDDQKEFSLRR